MIKGLVSVIVPVFNTQPEYLEKCLNSILNQSYKMIELIVVNDGSFSSDTISLLNSYSNKKNILRIDRKNGGVSSARNAGLEISNGEYILFVDSDDYLNTSYVEDMLLLAKDYDVVFSGKTKVGNGKTQRIDLDAKNLELSLKNDADFFLMNSFAFTSQGALIRSSIAKSEKFNTRIFCGEDTLYMGKILGESKFFYSGSGGYYYVSRQDSVSNTLEYPLDNYINGHSVMLNELGRYYCVSPEVLSTAKLTKLLNASDKLLASNIKYSSYKKEMTKYMNEMREVKKGKISKLLPHSLYRARMFILSHRFFFLTYLLSRLRVALDKRRRTAVEEDNI